jgi:hypothetical protein
MHRFLILSAFLLGAAFTPMTLKADDDQHGRRYYDREHRDYHAWNNREDRAYRVYLGEHRRHYREFSRETRYGRVHYFRWRHDHPDSALFKVEVR